MAKRSRPIRDIVLGRVAKGDPPSEIFADICLDFEQAVPGTIAGVTILDRTAQVFQNAVFPSLPSEYAEALQGIEVADKPGTCALASTKGKPSRAAMSIPTSASVRGGKSFHSTMT